MKQLYLSVFTLLIIHITYSQSEELEGVWVLDSIFDNDVILEAPSYSYISIIDNIDSNDNIYINGICEETYVSNFANASSENAIEILKTSWTPTNCPSDSIGWENALYGLFGNNNTESKEITYTITSSEGVEQLELDYFIEQDGITINYTGYFTRLLPPTNLLGTWYLHSITTDGVQHDNYIGEVLMNFTNEPTGYMDSFASNGGACAAYSSPYSITSDNSLNFLGLVELGICTNLEFTYLHKYIEILDDGTINPNDIAFEITEENEETQLTLTNSEGDLAVYKTTPPTDTIFKTWYSTSTQTEDGVSYPLPTDMATLTLSISDQGIGSEVSGFGSCNEFSANHNMYGSNENEFWLYSFNAATNNCEENTYEAIYFSVLSDATNALFSYSMQNEGETLVLTNAVGDILTFGSEPLPVDMLGEWFLHYLVVDTEQIYNPNPFNPGTINFGTNPSSIGYIFEGNAACNSFFGDYYFNPQLTFDMQNFTQTLAICDTMEEIDFELAYFYSVLTIGQVDSIEFSQEISGTGDDMSLVITNLSNGNQAVYGRQTLSVENNAYVTSSIELDKNPVDDQLSFSIYNLQNAGYKIYSITGKLISNGSIYSNTIDVSQLQSGLYFLKVYNDENNSEIVKFIKK